MLTKEELGDDYCPAGTLTKTFSCCGQIVFSGLYKNGSRYKRAEGIPLFAVCALDAESAKRIAIKCLVTDDLCPKAQNSTESGKIHMCCVEIEL